MENPENEFLISFMNKIQFERLQYIAIIFWSTALINNLLQLLSKSAEAYDMTLMSKTKRSHHIRGQCYKTKNDNWVYIYRSTR